uniref:Uncharacterized protein n=1 Tax=Parascaris equorum TaxID=6256 RepID=A0A914R787_PAREQ
MTIKYDLDEECRSLNCMQRISTLTPDQMRAFHEKSQHSLGFVSFLKSLLSCELDWHASRGEYFFILVALLH